MSTQVKISIVRLVLVNLIPVLGVIFLEWELFEIGITYILQTCAIYFVFELDYYFIDKHTRMHIVMSLIQLFFTALTFGGMMYGSALIMYTIITPQVGEYNDFIEQFFTKLDRMQILFPATGMFVIELVTFYIRKSRDRTHATNNTWRVIRRILYSHLYMVACLLLLSAFPKNIFVMITFFIGLKIVLDYSVEDERVFKTIGQWILKSRVGRWFKEDEKIKSSPKGYLSKNRTYSRRNKRK